MTNINNKCSTEPEHKKGSFCKLITPLCTFKINGLEFYLGKGQRYAISSLMKMAEIPQSHIFVRTNCTKAQFFKSDDCITINGNECFESCAGKGQAS